jgi:hypothetical protein
MKSIDHGTVEHDGKTLTLQQQPYCDLHDGVPTYMASCVDEDGNDYKAYWEITDDETENEDECCDWDDYTVRFCGEGWE